MIPSQLSTIAIAPGMSLLPARMDSPAARRMLIAIAIQESGLRYRQQVLRRGRPWWQWRGPARGWWQFEPSGMRGVLTHRASRAQAYGAMRVLGYESPSAITPDWASALHAALRDCDALAAAFARLLLWTLPLALPEREADGWRQYLDAWRPGRPHPETWPGAWAAASEVVQ